MPRSASRTTPASSRQVAMPDVPAGSFPDSSRYPSQFGCGLQLSRRVPPSSRSRVDRGAIRDPSRPIPGKCEDRWIDAARGRFDGLELALRLVVSEQTELYEIRSGLQGVAENYERNRRPRPARGGVAGLVKTRRGEQGSPCEG